ncbi:MAG: adenylate/guanylate cyclase domain-containing protein [Deltaproteobacteria bacterium]|nr:adenylate/guanylate cyclase domain-containing protein [Deltaproteobacteria bacterium]
MSATKQTEIGAIEASRNEAYVRAEGSLIGERRNSIARLVMIAMFGFMSNVVGVTDRYQFLVGFSYTVFGLVTLYVVYQRIKVATPEGSRWRPAILTVIDFAFVTALAFLDMQRDEPFGPGQHAIAASILITFAVTRTSVWHVVLATALAIVSHAFLAGLDGAVPGQKTLFVIGGMAVLGFMVALTNRAVGPMFAGLRQRDNLTRFMPRQVAERVLSQGPDALAPVEREITVLFSDIRGFTSMSEGLSPREVLAMLDDYFGRMGQIVKGHDGVIGKFMGDGLLAFWGVPDRLPDHAQRAVRAARDMRKAVRELNQHRANLGLPPIAVGIGIHTGPVAAGMLGGKLQAEYTVIGDAVNVASRVEGLTKEHKVDVLISETTWAQLPEPRRGDRLASVEIRGRKQPIVLYTIDGSAATVEVAATQQ